MKKLVLACVVLSVCYVQTSSAVEDRLELEETRILGNRELPRVTFVVPWREVEDQLPDWTFTRQVDVPLQPLDRETLQREIQYLQQLEGQTPASQ